MFMPQIESNIAPSGTLLRGVFVTSSFPRKHTRDRS